MTCNKPGSVYVLATMMEEDSGRARGEALALQQVSDALSIQVLLGQSKG